MGFDKSGQSFSLNFLFPSKTAKNSDARTCEDNSLDPSCCFTCLLLENISNMHIPLLYRFRDTKKCAFHLTKLSQNRNWLYPYWPKHDCLYGFGFLDHNSLVLVADLHRQILDAPFSRLNFLHFHAVLGKIWPTGWRPSDKSWIRPDYWYCQLHHPNAHTPQHVKCTIYGRLYYFVFVLWAFSRKRTGCVEDICTTCKK